MWTRARLTSMKIAMVLSWSPFKNFVKELKFIHRVIPRQCVTSQYNGRFMSQVKSLDRLCLRREKETSHKEVPGRTVCSIHITRVPAQLKR